MAQRRLFSPDIVASDAFLDMPISTQALYFHLGMYADDDGFVNPKKIMRLIGVSDDDLKVLLTKRFVLKFDSGVIVIKHWLIHNSIRKDRYHETKYIEEKKLLTVKENMSYTEVATSRQPNGNQSVPEVKLSKAKLSEVKTIGPSGEGEESQSVLISEVIKAFEVVDPKNKTYYGNKTQRKACDFLINEYGAEMVFKVIAVLPKTNKISYMPRINSPYDLKEKWVKLQDAMINKKQELLKSNNNVIW